MLGVALLFIGAVLLINGIALMGRIEPKDGAGLNLLVGILAFLLNMAEIAQATKPQEYFASAGGLFFCLYIFVPRSSSVVWSERGRVGMVLSVREEKETKGSPNLTTSL